MPTLHSQNHFLDSIPPGSAIMTSNLGDVWNKVHHALIQNHLGQVVVELGLEERGGWGVVKEVLGEVLEYGRSGEVKGFYECCLRATMTLKCCLGMMMQGKYRDVSTSTFWIEGIMG